VGDHVGRDVAVVVLEALDEVHAHAGRRGLLDRHDATVADGEQRLGEHRADHVVVVGGDRGDPGVVGLGNNRAGDAAQVLDQASHRHVDAALDQHRVPAGADRLHALADDRVGDDGGRRGAVTNDVVGLDGRLFDQLRAHVLELVRQVDLLGDRHSVVRHDRRAGDLLDDHVATLGAECRLDGLRELVDSCKQTHPGVLAEAQFLGHGDLSVRWAGSGNEDRAAADLAGVQIGQRLHGGVQWVGAGVQGDLAGLCEHHQLG